MSKAMKSEATATPTRINGVDIETLMGTVNAIKDEPELGACRFRASNSWLGGNHNRSKVTGFYGAKQEIAHRQTFTMDADEPAILAGNHSSTVEPQRSARWPPFLPLRIASSSRR